MNEKNVRDFLRIYDNVVLRSTSPGESVIHGQGACLLLHNNSPTLNAVVSLQDSLDGVTYNVLTFSDPWTAGLLNVTMVPQGFRAILFATARPYVRIAVAPSIAEGVYCHVCQWRPVAHEMAAY